MYTSSAISSFITRVCTSVTRRGAKRPQRPFYHENFEKRRVVSCPSLYVGIPHGGKGYEIKPSASRSFGANASVCTPQPRVVTLPPVKGGIFSTGHTSLEAILSHTLVFAVIFALLRKTFPQFY